MKIRIFILAAAVAAGSLFGLRAGVLDLEGAEASSIGIYIKNLGTGEVLVEENARLSLTPASVMKAITTASALSLCGSDTCFTTVVGLSGDCDGAVCRGNLVVRSVADPTVESENFKSRRGFCDSIAAALRRRGIRRIEGGIVVNQTLRDAGPNLQWEVEDIAWPYGAALHGFNYRDNTVTIAPATGEVTPEAPGLEVCVEKATENNIVRGINSNRLMVYTRDPRDREWRINATVPDPSAVFVAEMAKVLRREGIELGGEPVAAGNTFAVVYEHRSPRFGEIMRSLMVRSDNLFAESMLRALAPGASRKKAIDCEKALWNDRGVSTRCTTIKDGSGLARSNRLSPLFIADVLEWMARSPMADSYVSYFPRAGKDGTMRGFLAKSPLKGRIALKTGSVGGVQCYAGYKLDAKGKATHVVVIMVNGFFCPRKDVRIASEKLLTDLFL